MSVLLVYLLLCFLKSMNFFQKILAYLEKIVFLWVKIGLKHYY